MAAIKKGLIVQVAGWGDVEPGDYPVAHVLTSFALTSGARSSLASYLGASAVIEHQVIHVDGVTYAPIKLDVLAPVSSDGGMSVKLTATNAIRAALDFEVGSVGAAPDPVRLVEAVSRTDTTVTVSDGSTFAAGDLIYVRSECMLVTAVSTDDLTVERGALGTHAAPIRFNYIGSAVWRSPPGPAFRQTRVWEVDRSATSVGDSDLRYRGLTGEIASNESAEITLPINSRWGALRNAPLTHLKSHTRGITTYGQQPPAFVLNASLNDIAVPYIAVRNGDDWCLWDDTTITSEYDGTIWDGSSAALSTHGAINLTPVATGGKTFIDAENRPVADALDLSDDTGRAPPKSATVWPVVLLSSESHNSLSALVRTMLTSRYPDGTELPYECGLGLDESEIDLDSLRLIDEVVGDRLFNHALGIVVPPIDHKSLVAWLATYVLEPLGLALVVGRTGLKRIVSWQERRTATVFIDRNKVLAPKYTSRRAVSQTLSGVVVSSEDEGVGKDTVDSDVAGQLRTGTSRDIASDLIPTLRESLRIRWGLTLIPAYQVPRRVVELTLIGDLFAEPIEVGQTIGIDVEALPQKSGIVDTEGTVRGGFVLSTAEDFRTGNVTAKFLLGAGVDTGAVWSPSAEVTSWDSGALELTVEPGQYGDEDEDAEDFADYVGAKLKLLDQYGTPRSDNSPAVVSVFGGNIIELDDEFSMSAVTVTPAAGDVVVFAPYDEQPADIKAAPPGYWAGTDGELGAAGDIGRAYE